MKPFQVFNQWLEKFTRNNRFLARMIIVWIAIVSLGMLIYFSYGIYALRHVLAEFPEQHPIGHFAMLGLLFLIFLILVFLEVKFMKVLKKTKKN